ncbi:MAG: hypothetical protein JWO38_1899 [Gemmataceae bacterium]|nr:hypothetical protein [Gemmataceae bacterium]
MYLDGGTDVRLRSRSHRTHEARHPARISSGPISRCPCLARVVVIRSITSLTLLSKAGPAVAIHPITTCLAAREGFGRSWA